MQPPCEHRFAGASASGDDHTSKPWIHSSQHQGELQRSMAGDRRQRKGAVGLIHRCCAGHAAGDPST